MEQIRFLKANEIDVKVKKVYTNDKNEGRALLLLYKTARVDMQILDEVFGRMNWCNEYKEIKGNMYCGVGVRESEDKDFVWKWDCGIESREDDEGNQKKGEASDAFKRACFKIGIGRELYTAPVIRIGVSVKQEGKGYKLSDSFAKYEVKTIEYNQETGEITKLVIVDRHGVQVFPENKQQNTPPAKKDTDAEKVKKNEELLQEALKTSKLTMDQVKAWVKAKTKKDIEPAKVDDKTFNELINAIKKPENQKKEDTPPKDDIE